jgi:hypothetical protein
MDPEETTPGNSTIRNPAVHIRVYTLIDEIKPGRFPQNWGHQNWHQNWGQVYTLDKLSASGNWGQGLTPFALLAELDGCPVR